MRIPIGKRDVGNIPALAAILLCFGVLLGALISIPLQAQADLIGDVRETARMNEQIVIAQIELQRWIGRKLRRGYVARH